MKIALEVGWSDKPGGARRVAFNAANAMASLRPDHDYVVYCNRLQASLTPSIHQRILARPWPFPKVIWDQVVFPQVAIPLQLKGDKPDIVVHTNNLVPLIRYHPRVAIIHDMTPFLIPESFLPAHARYQQWYFRLAARTCERIVTVSDHSKQDICRILGVPDEHVVVAPLASNLDSTPAAPIDLRSSLGITKPFVLYVGAIHPRKNLARLILAFAQLKRVCQSDHQLVIAGARRWQPQEALAAQAAAEISEHLLFTGPVSEDVLVSLFRQCDLFVYPSIYEGFGLPVLEAMSLGAPVVTSNTSSLPEVAGDAALLVDPTQVEAITDAMKRVLTDPALAAGLRSRGLARAAGFSWSRHAAILLETLEAAA